MEFKGTKGSWRIRNADSLLETKIFCGSTRIAEVKHYNTGLNDWARFDPKEEQGKANAKLIAAAPDLLEALQYLKSQINLTILPESVEEKINKAIEKALK